MNEIIFQDIFEEIFHPLKINLIPYYYYFL